MKAHANWTATAFVICIGIVCSIPACVINESFPEAAPRPVGGGEDYNAWVTPTPKPTHCADPRVASKFVATADELLCALEHTRRDSGYRVVYVDDDAEIDLTGINGISIPAGVTLASGRGRNGSLGAKLMSGRETKTGMLIASEPDVRITGFRMRGPRSAIDWPGCYERPRADATAISITNRPCKDPGEWPGLNTRIAIVDRAVEIDNNEMWAWPGSAIYAICVRGVQVHHNHIHHNRHQERSKGCRAYGLGYGVSTSNGEVSIESNLFDHNRHDIASDGQVQTNYVARNNLVVEGAVQHSFDVHGGKDRCNDKKMCSSPDDARAKKGCSRLAGGCCCIRNDIAGNSFIIEDNVFLQSIKPAVKLRGAPVKSSSVDGNQFREATERRAVVQSNVSGRTRLSSTDNTFSYDPGAAWYISHRGESYWRWRRFGTNDFSAIRFGDFDGNGRTDAFRIANNRWQMAPNAKEEWREIQSSTVPLSKLAFGDFDGDGHTDILRHTDQRTWQISFGAQVRATTGRMSQWREVQSSTVPVSELALGDFDGDGHTDLFRHTSQNKWQISFGAQVTSTGGRMSRWREVQSSTVPLNKLGFGDFDGDGHTDIFRHTNRNTWEVSFGKDITATNGSMSRWRKVQSSEISLDKLAFGDFDGDGHTDVFRHTSQDTWEVSYGSQVTATSGQMGRWERINSSSHALSKLRFGDFDGDDRTDVLVGRKPW